MKTIKPIMCKRVHSYRDAGRHGRVRDGPHYVSAPDVLLRASAARAVVADGRVGHLGSVRGRP